MRGFFAKKHPLTHIPSLCLSLFHAATERRRLRLPLAPPPPPSSSPVASASASHSRRRHLLHRRRQAAVSVRLRLPPRIVAVSECSRLRLRHRRRPDPASMWLGDEGRTAPVRLAVPQPLSPTAGARIRSPRAQGPSI